MEDRSIAYLPISSNQRKIIEIILPTDSLFNRNPHIFKFRRIVIVKYKGDFNNPLLIPKVIPISLRKARVRIRIK